MKYLLMYAIAPAMIAFAVQSVLCRKVKKGILRHGTLIFPVFSAAFGGVTLLTQYGDIFGGLSAIAAVLWLVAACCAVLGYGAAWFVFYVTRKR